MAYLILACVVISFLFSLFASYLKIKSINTPMVYVSLAWHLLLVLSLLAVTSLDRPDSYSYFIFITALMSFSFGVLSSKSKLIVWKNNTKIIYIYIVISFVFLLPPFIKMISVLISEGYVEYLKLTQWKGSDITVLFASPLVYSVTNVIIKALIYSAFFYTCTSYFLNGRRIAFYFSVTLIVAISILLSSRIEILTMFLCIISCMILSNLKRKFFFIKLISLSCFGFLSVLYFSYVRSGGELALIEIINRYFVEYHTLGFVMFSKELMNPLSNLNSGMTWGGTTISILDYIPEQLSRFLDYEYISTARESRQFMSEPINVSQHKEANAFYTSIYLFYKDFNIAGVVLFPFIFGRFLACNYLNWLQYRTPYSLTMTIFSIYSGYTALFYPPQVTEFYWFTMLFIYLLYIKVLRRRC